MAGKEMLVMRHYHFVATNDMKLSRRLQTKLCLSMRPTLQSKCQNVHSELFHTLNSADAWLERGCRFRSRHEQSSFLQTTTVKMLQAFDRNLRLH